MRTRRMACRRVALGLAVALAATSPSSGQRAEPPTDVEGLVVRPPVMVPIPRVGEGAPEYTAKEVQEVHDQARQQQSDVRSDIRQCDQGAPMTFSRRATTAPSAAMPLREADDIGRAAKLNGGRIILPEPLSLVDALRMENSAAGLVINTARRAERAILAAEDARRRAAAGRATEKQVADSELARQAEVGRFTVALAIQNEARAQTAEFQWALRNAVAPSQLGSNGSPMFGGNVTTPSAFRMPDRRYSAGREVQTMDTAYLDLVLEQVAATPGENDKGRLLIVSGLIRNPRAEPVPVPPLSITAMDPSGFPLVSQTADPQGGAKIPSGQAVPFRYELKPSPLHVSSVQVSFGAKGYVPWRMPVGMFC